MRRTGRFVSLEGIDGAGKSIQTKCLADRLNAAGVPSIATYEPGGGTDGNRIRELLTGNSAGRYSVETELLLFMAARRNHVDTLIRPALADGKHVISDRFADSTRIYQGFEQPRMRKLIDQLHDMVIGVEPDLTFIVDIPVDVALERIRSRSGSDPRFEKLGKRVTALRNEFRQLAAEFPRRCLIIDGARSRDAIADDIFHQTMSAIL